MAHRLYAQVAERAEHLCEYCQAPEEVFNQEFEVDHVVARARQGRDELDNLALACRSCNRRKRDDADGRDPETGQLVPLFNPRQDAWDDHFTLSLESCQIEGLTPTGRATIRRLGLNRPKQVRARTLWLALGTTTG